MPGFVPSPNTVKVNLHWTIHGRPQLNVLHGLFDTVGPVPPGAAQAIFDAIGPALTSTLYASHLAASTRLTAVGVTDLRNSSVPEVLSTGTPVPGTNGTLAMPDQVSFVMTLRTAMTGRSHRGRIYTLGWAIDNVEADGTAAPNAAADAVAWHTAVSAAMSAQGMPLAIRSPALPVRPSKPGGDLPAKPFEITRVTSIEARDLIFDTNRRRTDLLRR